MTTIVRNIIDHTCEVFHHGHREISDDGETWSRQPRSDFVQNHRSLWFTGAPLDRMAAAKVKGVVHERAEEFEQLVDADPYGGYYYLAVAASKGAGGESLKWIMGGLAGLLNERKLSFKAATSIISAEVLGLFSKALMDGTIERTFAKTIFAEIVEKRIRTIEALNELIADPRFKAMGGDEIERILDQIIADNAEQYEKAKSNPKLIQFFVGQVMKATGGKAKPPEVISMMEKRLA